MHAGFFLPSNNKVALFQGLAGVECAAVARVCKDLGVAVSNDGGFAHRAMPGTIDSRFIALSGEYKIFAGTDRLP
jgi:hypothetical protein